MNHKISELQHRYGLKSRQTVYDRMRAVNVAPISRGEISSDALDKLDKLHEFLKNNPGAATWELPKNTEIMSTKQPNKSTGQLDNFNETLQLIERIAYHFTNKDPLESHKTLKYAATHFMLLPTSKVREITGVKPHGIIWRWSNFIFSKTSNKAGREATWRVQIIAISYEQIEEFR